MEEAEMTVEQWLASRKEAGLKIDPETAEVDWTYGLTLDPYGVLPELPEEYRQTGREYFARSPESDVWSTFMTSPRRLATRCGGSTWRSPLGWKERLTPMSGQNNR
jgi:hypothetical protein